jgi:hypothetical protein
MSGLLLETPRLIELQNVRYRPVGVTADGAGAALAGRRGGQRRLEGDSSASASSPAASPTAAPSATPAVDEISAHSSSWKYVLEPNAPGRSRLRNTSRRGGGRSCTPEG